MDRKQRTEDEELQDKLWSEYTELFDSLYEAIKESTGKEPTPSMMVRRFKDDYPELVQKCTDQ